MTFLDVVSALSSVRASSAAVVQRVNKFIVEGTWLNVKIKLLLIFSEGNALFCVSVALFAE